MRDGSGLHAQARAEKKAAPPVRRLALVARVFRARHRVRSGTPEALIRAARLRFHSRLEASTGGHHVQSAPRTKASRPGDPHWPRSVRNCRVRASGLRDSHLLSARGAPNAFPAGVPSAFSFGRVRARRVRASGAQARVRKTPNLSAALGLPGGRRVQSAPRTNSLASGPEATSGPKPPRVRAPVRRSNQGIVIPTKFIA